MIGQNEMDKIVIPMVEHMCDKLCQFPRETADQEKLAVICGGFTKNSS